MDSVTEKRIIPKFVASTLTTMSAYPFHLRPGTPEEISKIMAYCHEAGIPVTPAGARTGLSGGALPIHGGVLLSMERFNRIIEIDEKNHQVITEPGVITQVLQDAVKEKGLFYPPGEFRRTKSSEIWSDERLRIELRSCLAHWRNHLDRRKRIKKCHWIQLNPVTSRLGRNIGHHHQNRLKVDSSSDA
ncbi:MAG: hypothetical protein RLZZ30_1671 [Bacteroidota bacterium]